MVHIVTLTHGYTKTIMGVYEAKKDAEAWVEMVRRPIELTNGILVITSVPVVAAVRAPRARATAATLAPQHNKEKKK